MSSRFGWSNKRLAFSRLDTFVNHLPELLYPDTLHDFVDRKPIQC